jgi:phosphoglycolate phosphatase
MYRSHDRLVIFDADGTTIDAFHAIEAAFLHHGMDIGDLDRFRKRRKLFKYLGGLRELPNNLRQQVGKQSRKKLLTTLTEIYRDEAKLFPGMAELVSTLVDAPGIRFGLVTRNVTFEPEETLRQLFRRHDIDTASFDYLACISLREDKAVPMRAARVRFDTNPARSYVCGDEYRDYAAALACGMHPFIVSYGFENADRLISGFGVPVEVVAESPAELAARLLHALDLNQQERN